MIPEIQESLDLELLNLQMRGFRKLLDKFKAEGKIPPVILFTGLKGVGKRTSILKLVDLLFCDSTTEPECGKCASCVRAKANQRLDLHWLVPEVKTEGRDGSHGVDSFRELKEKQGFGPAAEPFRIVVITEAQRMTSQASNSMLKMLEEPPQGWVFFLLAENPSQILPTIRSRSLQLRFEPVTEFQLQSALVRMGFHPDRARILSRLSQGSIGRALDLSSEDLSAVRDAVLEFLLYPSKAFPQLLDSMAESPRNYRMGVLILESLLRDFTVGPYSPWVHEDKKSMLESWLRQKNIPLRKWVQMFEHLQSLRVDSRLPLNAKLLAQETLRPFLDL